VISASASYRIRCTPGIRERRFVEEGEDCVTLAIEASKEALEHSKLFGDAIDLVICATTTAPESSPSVACLLSDAVGAKGASDRRIGRVQRFLLRGLRRELDAL
jgi:3-oxoacyl-[acyl-carrier-protein] synthase III